MKTAERKMQILGEGTIYLEIFNFPFPTHFADFFKEIPPLGRIGMKKV